MNSQLGELIQQGYNALQDERLKEEQARAAKIAKAQAEAEEAWAEVEERAKALLPECIHSYLHHMGKDRPWEKPGAWPKLRIEIPELVPIVMALTPERILSAYQVPTNVYISGQENYEARCNFGSSEAFEELDRALGKAFEVSQRLLAKEVEAQELQRQRDKAEEIYLAQEEAVSQAKQEQPDFLKEATLSLLAAYNTENEETFEQKLRITNTQALIAIAEALDYLAQSKAY